MEDFNRLIELLLPTFLRNNRIVAMLRALIGEPLQKRHTDYSLFRANTRYDASITPQVCSLVHAIERKYDVQCEIQELDGKPYDFLVSIDRSADLNSIRGLITKFGLAGKTFLFALGDTVYSVEWTEYVNENLITTWEVEWIRYVNEHDGVVNITPYLYRELDVNDQKVYYNLDIIADTPVKSDIRIAGLLYRTEAVFAPNMWIKLEGMLSSGMDICPFHYDATEEDFDRDVIIDIDPKFDTTYTYVLQAVRYYKPNQRTMLDLPPIYAKM